MIKLLQIKKAINVIIKNTFGITPTSTDITEGFDRPSFFVVLIPSKHDKGPDYFERHIKVTIYYFSEEINSPINEVVEIQEHLELAFECKLIVEDRAINIDETDGEVIDGVLQFNFELNYFDTKDIEETNELADEIKIRKDV